MQSYNIIIFEDEIEIREELCLLLENEGYRVIAPESFDTRKLADSLPDLILLDLGLPGKDGFSICREIRKISRIPIIFVTSRDSSMDELKALSLGGDDYITKPYNIPVLLARIKAVLRRMPEAEHFEHKGLILNLSKGEVLCGGESCELTKNEMKILSRLMYKPGEIVSRGALIDFLWENQIYIDDNTLSVNITRLRSKLDALGKQDFIITRRGMGYMV